MPPGLYSILWEVHKAVRFVVYHESAIGHDETTLRDAISYVNAAMTARKIDAILARMVAKDLVVEGDLGVRFGLFDVKDHRISGGQLLVAPPDNVGLLEGVKTFVARQAELRGGGEDRKYSRSRWTARQDSRPVCGLIEVAWVALFGPEFFEVRPPQGQTVPISLSARPLCRLGSKL